MTVQRPRDRGARDGGLGRAPVERRQGHRLTPRPTDRLIEAWGPDRPTCLIEALTGLVESFARVPEVTASRVLPLCGDAGGGEDILVGLLEEVVFALDVFSVVPIRFHLEEAEDGGVAGDMEVVTLTDVEVVGPVPKVVSHRGLSFGAAGDGGWACRAFVQV